MPYDFHEERQTPDRFREALLGERPTTPAGCDDVVHLDAVVVQPLPPLGDRIDGPTRLQVRLEGEERHSHTAGHELAQIRKHLRLHERFAQAEVA